MCSVDNHIYAAEKAKTFPLGDSQALRQTKLHIVAQTHWWGRKTKIPPQGVEIVAHPASVGQLPIYCYPLPPALLTGGCILLDLHNFV